MDDELDWKLLDQLYGVVSQISNFCFETKKFCVTTEFVVLTLLAKFTADKLDHSLFVVAFAIPVSFWFLDAVAYYYQVSIRGGMAAIQERIKIRNQGCLVILTTTGVPTAGVPIIAPARVDKPFGQRVCDAVFNHSMWLYGFLIGADFVVWCLFVGRIIV